MGITECNIRQINYSMCWWIRGIVTRGFSGDLMETSVEVFLMVNLGITTFLILLAL